MKPTQSQIRDILDDISDEYDDFAIADSLWQHRGTIRTILQSALDTQKPAGDAANDIFERLHIESMTREWFEGPNPNLDGYLRVLKLRLQRAALNGDCGGGDLSALLDKIGFAEWGTPEHAEEILIEITKLYHKAREEMKALTADNAKRGE